MEDTRSLRSPLQKVRGLGSAKEGVSHWWAQRLTAVALVPLTFWFVLSVAAMSGADHAAMKDWVSGPVTASLLVLLIVVTFYHAALGLQVVIEDYIHNEWSKLAAMLVMQGAALLLATVGVVSVLILAVGG